MRIDCRWIALLLLAACAGMRDPETGSNDSGSSGLLTITASADEVTVGDSPVTLTAAPGEASWSLLGPGKLSGVPAQTARIWERSLSGTSQSPAPSTERISGSRIAETGRSRSCEPRTEPS